MKFYNYILMRRQKPSKPVTSNYYKLANLSQTKVCGLKE